MSTNYYYRYNPCECCGRFDEEHVGLATSRGTFLFQGNEEIRSFHDWLKFFEDHPGQLFDQYDEPIEIKDFMKFVKTSRASYSFDLHHEWFDDEGYLFSDRTFS